MAPVVQPKEGRLNDFGFGSCPVGETLTVTVPWSHVSSSWNCWEVEYIDRHWRVKNMFTLRNWHEFEYWALSFPRRSWRELEAKGREGILAREPHTQPCDPPRKASETKFGWSLPVGGQAECISVLPYSSLPENWPLCSLGRTGGTERQGNASS